MDICSSPWLFAAYHVFLRLLVPRHPPCALSCLTSHTVYSVTPYMLIASFFTLVFVRCISSSSWSYTAPRMSFLFVWSQYSVFKVHILLLTVLSVMKNRKISDFSSLVKTSYINIFIKMMFFIYKSFSALFLKKSGSHLLSHTVSSAVPSAA